MRVTVSAIIPVLNDAPALEHLLAALSGLAGRELEIIVVDGGSSDGSVEVAGRDGVRLIRSRAGRGQQLNAGIRAAAGDWLWLLHADCRVPLSALTCIRNQKSPGWGRFDVRLEPESRALALVAWLMNWRSRQTGICTGDQGMFVHRQLLSRIGGMPEQPLMEDIELARRLKRLCRPHCPRIRITASARRWERAGILRTVVRMWWLRLRYWLGASPEVLAREYYG